MPWKSTTTTGSFPTTHASCPGGSSETSPALQSFSVPSSITTCIVPDTWYWKCGASQLFVFTRGFTQVDQRHQGWNMPRPTVAPPILTSSSFPFSNVLVSSGAFVLLTSILLNGHQTAREPASYESKTFQISHSPQRRTAVFSRVWVYWWAHTRTVNTPLWYPLKFHRFTTYVDNLLS